MNFLVNLRGPEGGSNYQGPMVIAKMVLKI